MSNINENLIKKIRVLGLSEKEAKVYLALLQLGPSTPYRISKKAGIKRPTAYVITDELAEKGFLVKSPNEKQIYIARPASVIFEEFEERVKEVKKSLPELNSLQGGIAEKPSVLYFEGLEGIRQTLFYKLKDHHNKEIVGFFADASFANKELLGVVEDFNQYRLTHNIKARGLVTKTKGISEYGFDKYFKDTKDGEPSIKGKFVEKEIYSSNASFEFYEGFIKIIFFDTAVGVIIESATVAKAMKQIFEMVWTKQD